jgi:hypothetical protein
MTPIRSFGRPIEHAGSHEDKFSSNQACHEWMLESDGPVILESILCLWSGRLYDQIVIVSLLMPSQKWK